MISYSRPDAEGSRESDYAITPVAEPETLREVMTRSLGVRVVVEKRRALYLLGRTRIHLDRVAGLGPFVELETVLGEEDAFPKEHARVISLLGLDALPPVAGSYADLLRPTSRTRCIVHHYRLYTAQNVYALNNLKIASIYSVSLCVILTLRKFTRGDGDGRQDGDGAGAAVSGD